MSRLALTAGDSAGIGPDLCLSAATQTRDFELVCIADRDCLEARAGLLGSAVRLHEYTAGKPVTRAAGELSVLHVPLAVTAQPENLMCAMPRRCCA